MTARYQFLGHDVPEKVLAKFPDRVTVYDTVQRTHVMRLRTERYIQVPGQPKAAA